MIYGDGDGKLFERFTKCIDIVAHELTHGVTQYTAALVYSGESGALSEHFSDVFGVLVKQYARKQTAAKADWLVGAGLFTARVAAPPSAPEAPAPPTTSSSQGSAPSHMPHYRRMHDDNAGHGNSVTPPRLYLAATALASRRGRRPVGLVRDLPPNCALGHVPRLRERHPRIRRGAYVDASRSSASTGLAHGMPRRRRRVRARPATPSSSPPPRPGSPPHASRTPRVRQHRPPHGRRRRHHPNVGGGTPRRPVDGGEVTVRGRCR